MHKYKTLASSSEPIGKLLIVPERLQTSLRSRLKFLHFDKTLYSMPNEGSRIKKSDFGQLISP